MKHEQRSEAYRLDNQFADGLAWCLKCGALKDETASTLVRSAQRVMTDVDLQVNGMARGGSAPGMPPTAVQVQATASHLSQSDEICQRRKSEERR